MSEDTSGAELEERSGPDDGFEQDRCDELGLDAVPRGLLEAGLALASELALGAGAPLDAATFVPAVAVRASGVAGPNGGVVGWEALRVVGPVRLGGEKALLVLEAREIEGPAEAAVERGEVTVRVVPHRSAADARAIALEPGAGTPVS